MNRNLKIVLILIGLASVVLGWIFANKLTKGVLIYSVFIMLLAPGFIAVFSTLFKPSRLELTILVTGSIFWILYLVFMIFIAPQPKGVKQRGKIQEIPTSPFFVQQAAPFQTGRLFS